MKRAMVLAILLTLLVAAPVMASNGAEIPSFDDALKYASGAGVSILAGFFISMLLDYWPAYGELGTAVKRLVYLVLCLVIPVGAACLRGAMAYTPWSFDPLIWHALWSGAAAWFAGTAMHIKVRVASAP